MNSETTTKKTNSNGRSPHLNRWLLVLLLALLSGLIGRYYGIFVYGEEDHHYFRGFRTGFVIGLFASFFEIFYIRSVRRNWFRQVAFLPGLIVRVLVLTLIIRVGMILNGLFTSYLEGTSVTMDQFRFAEQFRDTLFSLGIVVVFVVVSQLTTTVGARRFLNMVAGRYFKPVRENRIFLFVDLVGSSDLARKLGNVRFHEYLSEFFYTIDHAIVNSGGEIVFYVGDSVIVTWPLGRNRTKNSRCLIALKQMISDVENHRDYFIENFDVAAKFRVALHGGEVVVGECGDSRKQITFLGDVVNTTARIEDASKKVDIDFLVSDVLAQQLELPKGVHFERLGETKLKGLSEPLLLHKIVFS